MGTTVAVVAAGVAGVAEACARSLAFLSLSSSCCSNSGDMMLTSGPAAGTGCGCAAAGIGVAGAGDCNMTGCG